MTGDWVSLFSGGKDSSWALYQALERDFPVERLLTVHPSGDSYLYHVPATELCSLAAESIGISLTEVEPKAFESDGIPDSSTRGDEELEPLERTLTELDAEFERGIQGVIVGAVESEYQNSRIEAMADRLDIDVYAPLWQQSPEALGKAMIDAGFESQIIQVAAGGLDESWLGRTLDESTLADLVTVNESHGVHILGEGGEFETLVTDGPHMSRPIVLEGEPQWDETRGSVKILDAYLGPSK